MGGGHFFGPTNTLYVHLTIIVTERTRDPCGPPPRPQAPPPQVHGTTICPFDHYSDGKTTGPLRTGPQPPLVHETTICPFDHYSHGATTGPLRTTARPQAPPPWSTKPLFVHLTIIVTGDHGTLADHRPTPGPTPRSTKPLFVHLTIIVTERPRDPCGPPPRPQAPPPQVHKTTICPFDHYSDGKTTGPLRTGPQPPLVHETTICPLDHYSHGATTGPLRTTARPWPQPPGPRNHYLSI
ncbi:uncharacterized protein LOC131553147 [Onychostoma macrolepis]|uniref:uncharacterized protein LOC131553147 n=1 Tax=Onychostoma macrolepis TaxID=369639 RepID=UPI00272D2E56|nr:uncharacterized protein LOC131553147 [Onychostoma macrolepis]